MQITKFAQFECEYLTMVHTYPSTRTILFRPLENPQIHKLIFTHDIEGSREQVRQTQNEERDWTSINVSESPQGHND